MIEITNKKDCSGCHACANICPKKCITMQADKEGFLYPTINKELCTNCGLCKKTCPIINRKIDEKVVPKAFACFNKDDSARLKSSSGGIFPLLAEYVLEKGGVVFGAGFNSELEVVHQYVEKIEDLDVLRMSKYVQSRIGETYKQAQEFLKAGRQVLFTGTPCQIEGLNAYLKKDYDNLLTQDLICHGVPSPAILKEYLKYRQAEANAEIKNVEFRSKYRGWHKLSFVINFKNGVSSKTSAINDRYMNMFLFNKNLRPSCHDCKFKKISRVSDITLADFWGLKKVAPELDDNKGTSLALVHSQKGLKVFEEIKEKLVLKEVDFKKATRKNPMIKSSSKKHPRRARLMRDFNKIPFKKFLKKHGKMLI